MFGGMGMCWLGGEEEGYEFEGGVHGGGWRVCGL